MYCQLKTFLLSGVFWAATLGSLWNFRQSMSSVNCLAAITTTISQDHPVSSSFKPALTNKTSTTSGTANHDAINQADITTKVAESSIASTTSKNKIPSSSSNGLLESYVISMSHKKYQDFVHYNAHNQLQNATLVWGHDGYLQDTMNRWADLTGLSPLNASQWNKSDESHKEPYKSAHAIGCYLSHWSIIDMLVQRPIPLQPEAYIIIEDDTQCMDNLYDHVLKVIRQLPPNWDMLYLAGKPCTFYSDPDKNFNDKFTWDQYDLVTQMACDGKFGTRENPLAPDGTTNISYHHPYWQTNYMANTHAYVLNPQTLPKLHSLLQPREYKPIDMLLGDYMREGRLKQVYMTPKPLCHDFFNEPFRQFDWRGWWFFLHHGRGNYRKNFMMEPFGGPEGCFDPDARHNNANNSQKQRDAKKRFRDRNNEIMIKTPSNITAGGKPKKIKNKKKKKKKKKM